MKTLATFFAVIAAVLSCPLLAQTQEAYLVSALNIAVQNNDQSWCPGTYRTLVSIDGGAPQCITITGYEPACIPPGWTGGAMGACTTGSGDSAKKRWEVMKPTAAAPVMLCDLVGGLAGKNAAVYYTWIWSKCSVNYAATPAAIPATSYLVRFGSSTAPVPPAVVLAELRSSWTWCSNENGYCHFPAGTKTVRYGYGNRWIHKSVANGSIGIGCNNIVWSDPFPGMMKFCQYMTKLP